MGKYLKFLNEHKDDNLATKIANELGIIYNSYWDEIDGVYIYRHKNPQHIYSKKFKRCKK